MINKIKFEELQQDYTKQHQTITELYSNKFFDIYEHILLCDRLISTVNMQYIKLLNATFDTTFVGTDEFYEIFGNLHEVNYDKLYMTAKLYNLTTITKV